MALARTNRGTSTLTWASNVNPSVTSSSFSPAAGSLLVVMVEELTSDTTPSLTMSSSLSGMGAWTKVATTYLDDGFGSYYSAAIFYATCGASPGTGTVTCTSRAGTWTNGLFMEVIEVTGQDTASPVPQTKTNTGASTSLALNFTSTPTATSYCFSNCIDGGSSAPTVPTNFTGLGAGAIPASDWNTKHGEDLGSVAQNNSWTGLGDFANAAVAIEVAQGAEGQPAVKRMGGVPFAARIRGVW